MLKALRPRTPEFLAMQSQPMPHSLNTSHDTQSEWTQSMFPNAQYSQSTFPLGSLATSSLQSPVTSVGAVQVDNSGSFPLTQEPHQYLTSIEDDPLQQFHTQGADTKHFDPSRIKRPLSSNVTGVTRRRISRACDQCNQLRAKCSGKSPCVRCQETKTSCTYERLYKKRGKAPRRQALPEEDAKNGDVGLANRAYPDNLYHPSPPNGPRLAENASNGHHRSMGSPSMSGEMTMDPFCRLRGRSYEYESMENSGQDEYAPMIPRDNRIPNPGVGPFEAGADALSTFMPLGDLSNWNNALGGGLTQEGSIVTDHSSNKRKDPRLVEPQVQEGTKEIDLSSHTLSSSYFPDDVRPQASHERPKSSLQDPGNDTLSSESQYGLQYPVLDPLMPHVSDFLSTSLACELLGHYFNRWAPGSFQPLSPYNLGFMFSSSFFLSRKKASRRRSPALLASMLWISARTSDSPLLNSPPHSRQDLCRRLFELSIRLLRPLIHQTDTSSLSANLPYEGGGVDDTERILNAHSGSGNLDDIGTYVHIATVVSASENKRASVRWWDAAWALARELRLGSELPADQPNVTPGEREERRRIWWMLYMQDRHLALCYNRPLFLLHRECDKLLPPMDESLWQDGQFGSDPSRLNSGLKPGPPSEFSGPSVFGFFLPVMHLLGEILDLNHMKHHPPVGLEFQNWDDRTKAIEDRLRMYHESIHRYESSMIGMEGRNIAAVDLDASHVGISSRIPPHVNTAICYGVYLTHVLFILTQCMWDPVWLLDEAHNWMHGPAFPVVMEHALNAADAMNDLLATSDPDLSLMPYFLGIYLLQGSFVLLPIAENYEGPGKERVLRACETAVRAHESCVVTLDTEYQKSFRRVLRSVLPLGPGRNQGDADAKHQWRRQILSRYRWNGDGGGLAV